MQFYQHSQLTMHTQMHTHLPEGFSGDALVLRIFRAKSSALKQSFRSSVSAIAVIDPSLDIVGLVRYRGHH
jgi:hypothetical protein